MISDIYLKTVFNFWRERHENPWSRDLLMTQIEKPIKNIALNREKLENEYRELQISSKS